MNSLKGSFLVAEPSLSDANFRRTVVLILEHGEGGAYGVVVNRPVMNEEMPLPVFEGGPCPSPGLVMVHGHRDWIVDPAGDDNPSVAEREIAPGIYIGDAACLNAAVKTIPGTPMRFRIFRNYAGWGAGQIEHEIAFQAWTAVPATSEILFDVPVEDLWALLRPHRIPQPSLN